MIFLKNSIFTLLAAITMMVGFGSCSKGKTFEIEGQLLNMNQGTIYVYSSDGLIPNIDTIQIQGGRFTYSRALERKGTLVLVFPNFSEVPVFGEPGEEVSLKGNAQQLTKLTINGTDDNELMTAFRISCFEKSPAFIKKNAEQYIKENAGSPVAVWLLNKLFIRTYQPDYKKALSLAKNIKKSQPDNAQISQLIIFLEKMGKSDNKGKLTFSTTDINGEKITNESIKGKKTFIYVAASWDYTNQIDQEIKSISKDESNNCNYIKILIDVSSSEIKRSKDYYSSYGKINVICDEKLFNSPLLTTLGLHSLEENILLDRSAKILRRNIRPEECTKLCR
ncbi:MAG: DUF4369 domain-containing protein [Prevotella sp.]|nr:DUF4369 domain-containing protein [Prevotella sp.]